MPLFPKKTRSLFSHSGRVSLAPLSLRPVAPVGRYPRRRFVFALLAVVAGTVLVAQQRLDASTRSPRAGASDYLTWLLRGEENRERATAERGVPGAALLASLPKASGEERAILQMDMAVTRAMIEQVQEGDTLFRILQRHGVARNTAQEAVRHGNTVAKQHRVGSLNRPFQEGKLLKLTFDSQDHLSSLYYPMDAGRTLHLFRWEGGGFRTEILRVPMAARTYDPLPVSPATTAMTLPVPVPTPMPAPLPAGDLFTGADRQVRDTVQSGDLLTTLLARHGINQATSLQVAAASRSLFNLARLMKPGQEIRLALDKEGQLLGVAYDINPETLLWVVRSGEGGAFQPHLQKKQFETQLKQVSGSINEEGSLFLAGKQAGLSHAMVGRLANLFEWDIDFARDIRAGDHFRVLFEAKYYRGHREGEGEIVAAEFVNQGRTLQVVRYVDPTGVAGYFDAQGQSIRKMLIRAPVDFTRITSLFTSHRQHPIYGYTRAHKGVDYAAPEGTPVRAAGAGKVTFVGNKGDYGQFITVRHNDTYSTAYAHLSSFTRGLRVGSTVKQGEVLGRVGSTGASTGPHLHYEVRVNEAPVNPLSVQQVMAGPVAAKYANDFRLQTGRMLAMLHNESTQVAALSSQGSRED
ncbi:MAG: peptidoglycan DD-metalloendopeptidase family protein [Magnetococcales bacterium]|nr:peptidoglycan DD-metalloendopeptidase family protein [Magnetococcales bacterium]